MPWQFFEKPCREDDLWRAVQQAIQLDQQRCQKRLREEEVEKSLATLTEKEQLVLAMIAEGMTKRAMAADLGVSLRAIEYYRAQLVKKLKTSTPAGLLRFLVSIEKVQEPLFPGALARSPRAGFRTASGRVATN